VSANRFSASAYAGSLYSIGSMVCLRELWRPFFLRLPLSFAFPLHSRCIFRSFYVQEQLISPKSASFTFKSCLSSPKSGAQRAQPAQPSDLSALHRHLPESLWLVSHGRSSIPGHGPSRPGLCRLATPHPSSWIQRPRRDFLLLTKSNLLPLSRSKGLGLHRLRVLTGIVLPRSQTAADDSAAEGRYRSYSASQRHIGRI
jgi:hypothetical protein